MREEIETASELIRSPVRVEILQRLEDGPATRYELRDALECARTTVDRNLETLCDDGWLTQSGTMYELTTCGEIVLEEATSYIETAGTAARLHPVLRWIPRAEFEIDVAHFSDAEITLPSEGQPMAMVDKHARALKQSPAAKMVTPLFTPQPMEAQFRNFSPSELDIEVVVPPSVGSMFRAEQGIADRLSEMRTAGAVEIYVTEEPIPYFLGLLNDRVQIGVDEDGQPRGLLESEGAEVREWAQQKFESYRERAESIEHWAEAET